MWADNLSDSNRLFDWAETNYPLIFNPPGQETLQLGDFLARYYQNTNTYLGTSGEDVYVYGDEFGGLLNVGKISDFIQTNTIYRFSEYFPVRSGNRWVYTTGERYFTDEIYTNAQGQTGLLYATDTYEHEYFFIPGNGAELLALYDQDPDGIEFQEFPENMQIIPEEMTIGESVSNSFFFTDLTFTSTLVSVENITVPAGTFETIKYKIKTTDSFDDGTLYNYDTYIWLAKDIGIIKIVRENLLPPKDGCILVCRFDDNFDLVNQPAELLSAIVDGINYPENPDLNNTLSLNGDWVGQANSNIPGCTGELEGSLIQNGNDVTGVGSLTGNCIRGGSGTFTGTIEGDNISFGLLADDRTTINFSGTISGDYRRISGTYIWPDVNANGTFILSLR